MRYLSYVLLQSRVKKSHVLQYLKRLSDLQYVLFVFSVQTLSPNDNVIFFYLFVGIIWYRWYKNISKNQCEQLFTHYIYLMASSNNLFWIKDLAVIILPLIPPVFSNSTVSRYRLSLNKVDKYYKPSFRHKYITLFNTF